MLELAGKTVSLEACKNIGYISFRRKYLGTVKMLLTVKRTHKFV